MKTRFFIVFLITVMYAYVTFGVLNYHGIIINYTLCGNNHCLNTASEIEARLNRTVDPCDNFYEFACGGWLQKIQLNRTKLHVSMFTEITEQTKNQLRELLEEPAKESDTESFRKAKKIYAQCLTNDNSDANIINFTAILSKYVEWPLIMPYRNWDDGHLSWQNVSNVLLKNGFDNGLFNIKVKPDFQSFKSNVIYITDPVFFFSRDVLLQLNRNEIQKKQMYIHIITTIALHLIDEINGPVDLNTLTRDVEDIVNFEIELARLTMDYRHYVNISQISTMLTIQQLQEKYDMQHPKTKGKIDWLVTIQNVFASEGIAIRPSEKLVVQAYKYLTELVPLLERTSSRTIVNHMIWNSVQWFYFRYIKKLEPSNIDNWWKTCITQLNLKHAILHEYVKKYVSNNAIQDITQIIKDVRNAIGNQINTSIWMDEPTRVTYLKKLINMRHEFIRPEWYSNEAIDRYYKNINVSTNYFDTVINLYQFESKKKIRLLRTPDITFEWDIDLTSVQTYYNSRLHKTVFPATILQNPIYDENFFEFINYGALGFIIGHRINFALIDNYVKYNNDGTVASLLTTQNGVYEYTKIVDCFVDQYNKYPYPGLEHDYVDGKVAIKESLVDSAAIATAYDAFKNRARLHDGGYEWRLQGLEQYSDDQIFFIAYAQMMCENTSPKIIEMRKKIIYAPNEIRIRGSLSNFPAFSAAYNCPVGKPMNPKSKCALW